MRTRNILLALSSGLLLTGLAASSGGMARAAAPQPTGAHVTVISQAQHDQLYKAAAAENKGKQPPTSCQKFPGVPVCNHGKTAPKTGASLLSPTGCITGSCGPLTYHGGVVQERPAYTVVLWGPKWNTENSVKPVLIDMAAAFGIENSLPADAWITTLSQYGSTTTSPSYYDGLNASYIIDSSTPPFGATQTQLANEALAMATATGIPLNDTQADFMIATQEGTCPAGFAADSPCPSGGTYCGWHTYVNGTDTLPYSNIPYFGDSAGCRGSLSAANAEGVLLGHETAESITSPLLSGWYNTPGGEVADECPGSQQVSENGTLYYQQSLFSNAEHAVPNGTSCNYTDSGPSGRMTAPRTTCLEIHGSGIVNGAVIDNWACEPSGHPNQQFVWYPDQTIRVKGKCLNDTANGGQGAKIILYTCGNYANEHWTFDSATGHIVLALNGLCLNDANNGGAGTQQIVWPCGNYSNEVYSQPEP